MEQFRSLCEEGNLILIQQFITDNPDFDISVYDKFVDDIAPIGATNAANYITRTLTLSEAAEAFKIIFDGNIVNNTSIKVFYRTWVGDTDLNKLPWADTGYASDSYDQEGKYKEREIDLTNLTPFNNVQIKIVFKLWLKGVYIVVKIRVTESRYINLF